MKWTSEVSQCDLCGIDLITQPYFVDGKYSNSGAWAIMCPKCHLLHGCGVGIGLGQAYDVKTKECIIGESE